MISSRESTNPVRPHRAALFAVLLLVVTAIATVAAPALAAETDEIEGVWSFNGGAVGIQGLEDGSFQGTVVSPTKFDECDHPVGQVMWTAMKKRPDGSYWGFHQWYQGTSCEVDPELGLTAWRVVTQADGSRVLEVCFSKPGDESQPKIAVDGTGTGATFGCVASQALGALPGSSPSTAVKFESLVGTPASTTCLSRHSLKIVIRHHRYDPLKELLVRVNGHKVADLTSNAQLRHHAIRLKQLPEGAYTVRVVAVTVLNQRLVRKRKYRTCSTGPAKLRAKTGRGHGH